MEYNTSYMETNFTLLTCEEAQIGSYCMDNVTLTLTTFAAGGVISDKGADNVSECIDGI